MNTGMNLDELTWFVDHDQPKWNGWRLDAATGCIYFGNDYDISLDRCRTPAQVLDWIMQISNKGWATDSVLAGLVRILGDVLDPQANLCSFGEASTLTPEQIAERVRVVTDEPRSQW